ncbi:MAG: adenylate/guanylate cyclase domain-containing protein [Hyphomicrobiaceae bacterium]
MTDRQEISRTGSISEHYVDALVASGLIDDVADVSSLLPRPYHYTEGEFICKHGDPVNCLWVIVNGSVAIKQGDTTFFVRRRHEVIGEQHIVGNGYRRIFDLVAAESFVEVLTIEKAAIDAHTASNILWRNIARVISVKLRNASRRLAALSRQLQDDTRILHAYTNEYALSRRLEVGGDRQAEYKVDRAIIWFSDVVDFSRYTLKLAPERTADIVQRFFNAQTLPIVTRGGHIDKFIGDGLMAFWVLSEKNKGGDRELVSAVRAAEEAVKGVDDIAVGSESLRLRIGLHVGHVLSGDFGSTTRHQFTLIGTEVNKAARLEQAQTEDIVGGSRAPGDIRISTEFRSGLSAIDQQRYNRRSVAQAKNIGELQFYSG